jgi:hypothetical protein
VRRRLARGAETLERGGDSPEGPGPSNKAEARSRGAAPSSEARVSATRLLALEQDEGSSRAAYMAGLVGH